MDVLAMLKVRGSSSLSEIATQLGVSKQGALRHLEALQAKGLVEVTTGSWSRFLPLNQTSPAVTW